MSITYRLDVALASTPLAATPTWTDLSAFLRLEHGVTISRGGRPDEFSAVQPGNFQCTLDNSGGQFTMGNASSAYYPNVVKNKRLRFTAIVGGVEYPRFDGHVDDWELTYSGGTTSASLITLTATNRFKLIARRGPLRSFLAEEVLADSPLAYLPFGDSADATTVQNIAANPVGNGVIRNIGGGGSYTLGTGTGPPSDGSAAFVNTPASSVSGYLVETSAPFFNPSGTPYGVTLEGWINSTTAITAPVVLLSGAKSSVLSLTVDGSKHLQAFADFGGLTASSATVVANGATRHVAVTVVADGANHTMRLYIDGTQVNSSTIASTITAFGCDRLRVGGDGYNFEYTGTISHVAFHPTALSAARINAHYHAGWDGFAGERTDQRVGRIAAYVGLTSTLGSSRTGVWIFDDAVFGLFDTTTIFGSADVSLLEQGTATVYGQNTGGSTAQQMFDDIATTENGVVLMTRDGLLAMQGRQHRYNRAPLFSIASTLLEQTVKWNWDDSHQVNVVTATTEDGIEQRAANLSSVTNDTGIPATDELSLLTRDPLDAFSNASWRTNRYGSPQARASQVALDLGTLDDATAAVVMPADVGDPFAITGMSSAWAPGSTASLFIEDYSEDIGLGKHLITWATSNATASQVWVFDDSRYGVFDSTTIFAFAYSSGPLALAAVLLPGSVPRACVAVAGALLVDKRVLRIVRVALRAVRLRCVRARWSGSS